MSIGAAVLAVLGAAGAAGAAGCCAKTVNAEIAENAEKTTRIFFMFIISAHTRFALRVLQVLVDLPDEARRGHKPGRRTVVQVVVERRLRGLHLLERQL